MSLDLQHEPSHALRPPQFGLRAMLLAVVVLSLLFGLMNYFGGYGAFVLALFVLLIAAHVLGNVLGTRLREINKASAESEADRRHDRFHTHKVAHASLPPSRLSNERHVSRAMYRIAAVGAGCGLVIGGAVTAFFYWSRVGAGGVLLGACSAGVLFGLAGFLVSSFVTVTRGAWDEALGKDRRPKPR